MSKTENNILLFSVTLCWAASYVFIKDLPPSLSNFGYLTMACGIAALILTVIFWKQLLHVRRSAVARSFVLAAILTVNLLFDKLGIDGLPSSTASVLASTSILIVPVIMLLMGKRITANNVAGAVIIMAGVLVTSGLKPDGLVSAGSLFMLLSALMASVYTIVADRVTKEEDPITLTVLQMWMSAAMSFVVWLFEDPRTFWGVEYSNQMLSSIFILAFFGKAYAYVTLMFSQRFSDPISVTIIGSTEPVVTLVLAVLIPSAFTESFTPAAVIGALVICAGAIVSGTDFLSRRRGRGGEVVADVAGR